MNRVQWYYEVLQAGMKNYTIFQFFPKIAALLDNATGILECNIQQREPNERL